MTSTIKTQGSQDCPATETSPAEQGSFGASFEARMAGKPYTAGGIATTVGATRAASDEELTANLRRHVDVTVDVRRLAS